LKHFDHTIIEAGAESLAILIDQVVVSALETGNADDLTIDGGHFGCLAGTETANTPEDEYNYDGEQNHFDHPTASMFPHYVEHSLPLPIFYALPQSFYPVVEPTDDIDFTFLCRIAQPMKKVALRGNAPLVASVSVWFAKISYFFKRLKLDTDTAFVNSLALFIPYRPSA